MTTLVAAYRRAHPRRSAAVARARVLRSLELPAFYDPGVDFGGGLFDGQRFARQAARHGGFDRYVARLASRVDRHRARAAAVASAACWKTAAQSTAGFAAFLGFRNVPGSPTPACTASASGAPRARAAQFGEVVGVLGDVIGVADGGYSIFAGQSTAATLDAMQQQLDEMQTQLTAIQTGLSELQLEVAAVNQNVTNGNLSSAVDAAEPIVTNIRKDGQDVDVLLRDSYQVICDPTTNCQSTKQYGNFGDAIADICYPNDQSDVNPAEATQCNSYYQQLYDTNHAIAKDQYEPAVLQHAQDLVGVETTGRAGLRDHLITGQRPVEEGEQRAPLRGEPLHELRACGGSADLQGGGVAPEPTGGRDEDGAHGILHGVGRGHRDTAALWSGEHVHKRALSTHAERAASPRGDRPFRADCGSGLAEDAVHLRSAHGAETLGHAATGVAHLDLAVEVALLLALDAVAVVSLRHGVLLVVGGDACPGCPRRVARGAFTLNPSGLRRDNPVSGLRAWRGGDPGGCAAGSGDLHELVLGSLGQLGQRDIVGCRRRRRARYGE